MPCPTRVDVPSPRPASRPCLFPPRGGHSRGTRRCRPGRRSTCGPRKATRENRYGVEATSSALDRLAAVPLTRAELAAREPVVPLAPLVLAGRELLAALVAGERDAVVVALAHRLVE